MDGPLCYRNAAMMKYLLTLAALLCFASVPSVAQEDASSQSDGTTLSPEELKAQKKAAREAKKKATQKKLREKLKFKWHKSLKSALKAAKKNHCTSIVLFTDPATCPPCRKLDEEIFNTKEFSKVKGIGVGFRSSAPIKEYNLGEAKPMGVIVNPEGKVIGKFGYSGTSVEEFVKMLETAQPKIDVPGEEEEEEE